MTLTSAPVEADSSVTSSARLATQTGDDLDQRPGRGRQLRHVISEVGDPDMRAVGGDRNWAVELVGRAGDDLDQRPGRGRQLRHVTKEVGDPDVGAVGRDRVRVVELVGRAGDDRWEGKIRVHGASVESVEPWAQLHPEQRIIATADGARWETISYGADMGVVLRIDDLAAAEFEIDARIRESDERRRLRISGGGLLETHRHDIPLGGLDLHLCVERIADPTTLPRTVTGRLAAELPTGESVLYVRARQWDGHQLWTSPLFFTPAEPKPSSEVCVDPITQRRQFGA